MTARHIILASVGTDGDVLPYIGLGVALRRRGHRATLVASEGYRKPAELAGMSFRALMSEEENDRCFGHPDFWHPLKGALVAARWGAGLLPRQYKLFADMAGDARSVFVANPGLVSIRLVQETLNRPVASVILQPGIIPSCAAPPVMPGGLTLPQWAPRPVGELYWRGLDLAGALLIGRTLNALRRRLGLPPVRRLFRWWLSPTLVIGMFPAWYGPPQPDWPPQLRLAGFPMFDGVSTSGPAPDLPPELAAFCDAPGGGRPPVAFTFGTGMRHGVALFRAAADACRALGVRAIFLTKYTAQLPAPLPPHVRHVPFAPFRQLFPRCSAVVHHGGVGTTAECLAAGIPQLVLPLAFDQSDNATRVKHLGAGVWLPAGRATAARIAAALAGLMTPDARAACASVAPRFTQTDALDTAAALIEGLGGQSTPRRSMA